MTDKGVQLHSKWTFQVYADGNPDCSPYAPVRRSGSSSPSPSGTVLGTFNTVQVINVLERTLTEAGLLEVLE